ncbi:hypothetical protein [uncultured Duncaniella sp.]|uniref:hypothetical protein n=1 Tax=uncultured Duncaniella sp. TaxID=2768039 RepID=UPI0025A93401|nr:hypothetical protein [uncultured Duncaniella sp.]
MHRLLTPLLHFTSTAISRFAPLTASPSHHAHKGQSGMPKRELHSHIGLITVRTISPLDKFFC